MEGRGREEIRERKVRFQVEKERGENWMKEVDTRRIESKLIYDF